MTELEGYERDKDGMLVQKKAQESPPDATNPLALQLTERINDMAMSSGLTFDEDQFCIAYLDTGKAKEAYERVYGGEPAKKDLTALMAKPAVIMRVSVLYNQIMGLMQQSCRVDIDLLVRELEQARQLALQEHEASAAIAATMGKAKLHGLMVDRKEISMKRPEDMTEAELRQVLGDEFEQDLKVNRKNRKLLENS